MVKLPAILRKNSLFVGSESGGHRAAILLSIVASSEALRSRTVGLALHRSERMLSPFENGGAVREKFRGKMATHMWAIDEASKWGVSPVLMDFTEVRWKCDVTRNNGKRSVSMCW